MKNLASLLERFSRSLGKDTFARDSVVTIVESLTSIVLKPEEISVKEGVLEISSTPGKNSAIHLKEDSILDALKSSRGLNISRIFYK